MKIKEKLKHFLSFLLHGERPPIYARINVLKPDKRLWGRPSENLIREANN